MMKQFCFCTLSILRLVQEYFAQGHYLVKYSLLLFLTLSLVEVAPAQDGNKERDISPSGYLGREIGTDFELADWSEVSGYYRHLGKESPRVITQNVGTSTEGRDFLISIISSEKNLARLDEIKKHAVVIADPRGHTEAERGAAVDDGRLIMLVSPQMHSTEAAGSEAAMEFAHQLATSPAEPWVSARQEMVTVIFACANPDGLDHVVNWYREHVGTPYEATGLLELYQKYTGHDNNRDWFMLTQQETRVITEQIYQVWHPQAYWDIHQQGGNSERFFVPPYRDPLNPNIDPAIVAGIDAIGSRALLDMTARGLTGISTGVTYDMWWNGGNRSTPTRHNIMGFLTEAASVDLATPVFLRADDLGSPGRLAEYQPSVRFPKPWLGGWWRLADIIEYQVAFGESLVGSLSRERAYWLRNALEAAERAVEQGRQEGPRAWIIPSDNRDPDAVHRLVDVLLRLGIEIHRATESFSADGREYPAGSLVIQRAQPYAGQIKDLFEIQRYPKGNRPYDVAGWTLPLLLGVHRVEVMEPLEAELEQIDTAVNAIAHFEGIQPLPDTDGIVHSSSHSSSWQKAFEALAEGEFVSLLHSGRYRGLLAIEPTDFNYVLNDAFKIEELPRIGLYAPWYGSKDEGWTRWVFDEWAVPYQRIRNEQLRAGNLHDMLDVLVIPAIRGSSLDDGRSLWSIPAEYARGLAPEGAAAVEEFVRTGGKLITFDASSDWAIDLLQLPVVNVTEEDDSKGFSCPGSVLRAIPVADEAINAGLPPSLALFFAKSGAYREMTKSEREDERRKEMEITPLLRYAPSRVLLSGWIEEPEVIAGRDAWLHVEYGDGQVHLFGFRPQYRAWSQATFPLIFRALLFDVESEMDDIEKGDIKTDEE